MKIKGITQAMADANNKKAGLLAELSGLVAYLDSTRYHVDIAFETKSDVFPDIEAARTKARARVGEIQKELVDG